MADVIAICDKEPVFVQIFADYLRKKFKAQCEIQAFDRTDRLLSMAKDKSPMLCLVGDGMLDTFQLQTLLEHSEHLIYLSGKRRRDMVFKYQSVEKITGDLLQICDERNIPVFTDSDYFKKRQNMKIIAFYAPAHHLLQSTLALSMGQMIARDKRVLYLNFEPFSAFDYLLQRTYEHDLMDIFFFLQEEKAKFRLKMESVLEHIGNMDYIPPVFCYPDMEDIDASLWQKLLQRIMDEMDYDVLVLDLTEQTRGLFSMLEMCDEIYTCLPDDGLALAKVKQYERLLVHMKKENILAHTRKSIVPVFQDIPLSTAMFTHGQIMEYIKTLREHTPETGVQEENI